MARIANTFVAFLALLVLERIKCQFFIPGTGCGLYNKIIKLSKLPEDETELANLACVETPDKEGYAKWHNLQKGQHFFIKKLNFISLRYFCNCRLAIHWPLVVLLRTTLW